MHSLMDWCDLDDPRHLELLRKGIEYRLESEDFRPLATLIWAQLCDLLKINKTEVGLEPLPAEKLFVEDPEPLTKPVIPPAEEKPAAAAAVVEKKEEKQVGKLEYTENDSDNESDFEPYDTRDDYEDVTKIRAPRFLYDCLLGLDSENPQRYEYSLEYCESLVRSSPDLGIASD